LRKPTPVATNRTRTVFSIRPNCFLRALEARMNGPMAAVSAMKGRPRLH